MRVFPLVRPAPADRRRRSPPVGSSDASSTSGCLRYTTRNSLRAVIVEVAVWRARARSGHYALWQEAYGLVASEMVSSMGDWAGHSGCNSLGNHLTRTWCKQEKKRWLTWKACPYPRPVLNVAAGGYKRACRITHFLWSPTRRSSSANKHRLCGQLSAPSAATHASTPYIQRSCGGSYEH